MHNCFKPFSLNGVCWSIIDDICYKTISTHFWNGGVAGVAIGQHPNHLKNEKKNVK
jgi:hypothetical protein